MMSDAAVPSISGHALVISEKGLGSSLFEIDDVRVNDACREVCRTSTRRREDRSVSHKCGEMKN